MKLEDLKIKIFADGADLKEIAYCLNLAIGPKPLISGFTTNPTLCRKAGVTDYAAFGKEVTQLVAPRPVSFEVFADDLDGMEEQARKIAAWGENVYVKIPITNTQGVSTAPLVRRLSCAGIKLNVTAVTTLAQIDKIAGVISLKTPAYFSIFAGRIADTGVDPRKIVDVAVRQFRDTNVEIIWASPREVLNVIDAESCGCHIITATPDILNKLSLWGKDLKEYSLETVRMFARDAQEAAYALA